MVKPRTSRHSARQDAWAKPTGLHSASSLDVKRRKGYCPWSRNRDFSLDCDLTDQSICVEVWRMLLYSCPGYSSRLRSPSGWTVVIVLLPTSRVAFLAPGRQCRISLSTSRLFDTHPSQRHDEVRQCPKSPLPRPWSMVPKSPSHPRPARPPKPVHPA